MNGGVEGWDGRALDASVWVVQTRAGISFCGPICLRAACVCVCVCVCVCTCVRVHICFSSASPKLKLSIA